MTQIFWHWLQVLQKIREDKRFVYPIRGVLVFLLVQGVWVATNTLDIPDGYKVNDKLIHVVVFIGFAFLADLSSQRKPFWIWKGLPLLVYGACIEIMQYFVPERSFSLLDWLADFGGLFLYYLAKQIVVLLRENSLSSS